MIFVYNNAICVQIFFGRNARYILPCVICSLRSTIADKFANRQSLLRRECKTCCLKRHVNSSRQEDKFLSCLTVQLKQCARRLNLSSCLGNAEKEDLPSQRLSVGRVLQDFQFQNLSLNVNHIICHAIHLHTLIFSSM